MNSSYVLKVPDLHVVLNQEDIVHWEVFLKHASTQYKKVRWQISKQEKSGSLQQVLIFYGRLRAAKIDFQNKRVVFYRGRAEQGEFEEFLLAMLENVFIQVHSNQLHFIVSPKYSCKKEWCIIE